jgi:signal transduction histidine kinase
MKLAGALAVPLVGLLAMTVIEMRSISGDVSNVRTQVALARAAVGPGGLISVIQNERAWPALELTGSADLLELPIEDYAETRAQTDEAITKFEAELADLGPEAVAAYAPAMSGLDKLDQLRADIDADATSPNHGANANNDFSDQIYARYTAIMRAFFDATDGVARGMEDDRLQRGTNLVNLSSRHIELFSDTARTVLVIGLVRGGVDQLDEVRALTSRAIVWDAQVAQLRAADAPYDKIVERDYPDEFVDPFTQLVANVESGQQAAGGDLVAPLQAPRSGGLIDFRDAMSAELTRTAADVQADALRRERMFAWLAGVTLVVAFVLTWLVSRSITRPLRSLTEQARDLANGRLPVAVDHVLRTPFGEDVVLPEVAPVRVATRDEVVDVANALNSVQQTALDLAVGQAVLRRNIADSFVNLGRRNQNLLRRQLDYITEFEKRESDPDALSNLFRLDHLATRMRRNAESLLVLANIEPARRWVTPVSLSDVVRSALGEVEDFQRVAVRDLPAALVAGQTTADLAHLLAELVENALVFSPPQHPVEIRGSRPPDGSYRVSIVDRGPGMKLDDLAGANRRLAQAESFTVSPSKNLGHFVAGNLAARHGIAVHLEPSPDGRGLVAVVDLPPSVVADTAGVLADGPGAAGAVVPGARGAVGPGAPGAPATDQGAPWGLPSPADAPNGTKGPVPVPAPALPGPGGPAAAAPPVAWPANLPPAPGRREVVGRDRGPLR